MTDGSSDVPGSRAEEKAPAHGAAVEFLPAEPEPAQPARPLFLPPEPPSTPEPPAPAPDAAPRGQRRRLMVLGAAGVAAVVLLGGAAWALGGSSGDAGPKKEERFTSFPAACSTITKPTVAQYVPRSEQPLGDKSGSQQHSWCMWSGQLRAERGAKRVVYRTAKIDIVAYESTVSAKSAYDSAWRTAVEFSGSSSTLGGGKLAGDASEPVNGLGDQAFFYHRTSTSALGRSGEAGETIRLRNLIVTVAYGGFTAPADELGTAAQKGQVPLDTATGRPGADALGHDAVNALNACPTCLHRV